MKFIVRNLGWILLIIFFAFMLYLISNQNNVKKSNTNSGAVILNSDNKKLSEESNIIGDEKGLDLVKDFFTLDSKEDKKIIISGKNSVKKDDSIVKAKDDSNKIEKKSEAKVDNKIKVNKNNIKKLSISEKDTISKEIKEKIEKRNNSIFHKVGVHSIALNNSYFTKKVGYAYKGDKLEQLTNTNSYGCFNSEVLESKISKGKKGWTCIYYMEGHLNEISKYQKKSIEYYKNLRKKRIAKKVVQNKIKYINLEKSKKIDRAEDGSIIITKDKFAPYNGPKYDTEVGSLYLVRVNSLKLNDKTFTTKKGFLEPCTSKSCDVLEQLSPVNEEGCFKINVYMSKNNKNKRGYVCQKYLR